jgi:DNA-directed RNA polymerase I subunit RPA2
MATESFDPLSPATASTSAPYKDKSTFHTLSRERQNRHPPISGSDVPALDELVAPHLESFNALVEDGESGVGLLQLGVNEIGEKVVFDGQQTDRKPWGNKITCKLV